MLVILAFLIVGVLIGFLLRKSERVIKLTDQLLTWFIYLFLLILGIMVGANETIMKNLGKLGIQALVISISVVIGSTVLAYITYSLFFKRNEK